jgi:hypothetical protein
MMEGKAYSKTLRACNLTDAALHNLIFESVQGEVNSKETVFPEEYDYDSDLEQLEVSNASSICPIACEVLQPSSSPSNLATDLHTVFQDLLSERLLVEDVCNNETLLHLEHVFNNKKETLKNSRTAQLWLTFMRFVKTVRMLIRAERCGNWSLHLRAMQDALPIFSAAGHNKYAKCARLYLMDSQGLCECLQGKMEEGLFTIRRNATLFWSGTWSDMIIEQSLMRSGKAEGGLINITHKEAARTKWLLSAHTITQYSDSLRTLTDVSTGTWSEQHREMHCGRIKQDRGDFLKIHTYLRFHNPFEVLPTDDVETLRNISTGTIADDRVNVDQAFKIGEAIQEKITNQNLSDVKFKKVDQVNTFALMSKKIKLDNEATYIPSDVMYQRLVAIASSTKGLNCEIASYELAAVAPALFHDDGSMRKATKAKMANHIISITPNAELIADNFQPDTYVIDGCALLHQIPWPKVGTLGDAARYFVIYVTSHFMTIADVNVSVVFDSYDSCITKDVERKRRKIMHTSSADIVVTLDTPVPTNKATFLANEHNKKHFIKLVGSLLLKSHIAVQDACEEGDADVVLVRLAMSKVLPGKKVVVVSEDCDVLVLLIHHTPKNTQVFMQTKSRILDISVCQTQLGKAVCKCLPFIHAMSGCDTTSSFFGFGKIIILKLLQAFPKWIEEVSLFGDPGAEKEKVVAVGQKLIVRLYEGTSTKEKNDSEKTLDELRYRNMISTKYVPLHRMPPTSAAAAYHCLRVHHQTSTWLHLRTVLNKEEFGFKLTKDRNLVPIISNKPSAPEEVLKDIRCSCCKGDSLCTSCSCFKRRLLCTIHCKCQGECSNASHFEGDVQ